MAVFFFFYLDYYSYKTGIKSQMKKESFPPHLYFEVGTFNVIHSNYQTSIRARLCLMVISKTPVFDVVVGEELNNLGKSKICVKEEL